MRECGQIMRFLLRQREQFDSEQEFRQFLLQEIRQFVKDIREYDIIVSLLPESLYMRSGDIIATASV
jgi:hypothetical protein